MYWKRSWHTTTTAGRYLRNADGHFRQSLWMENEECSRFLRVYPYKCANFIRWRRWPNISREDQRQWKVSRSDRLCFSSLTVLKKNSRNSSMTGRKRTHTSSPTGHSYLVRSTGTTPTRKHEVRTSVWNVICRISSPTKDILNSIFPTPRTHLKVRSHI